MATKDRTALKDEFKNGNLATGERFADLIDSVKPVQEPVADPAASGTSLSFIDSISQDADGKITATKKTLDLANAHELNPFKGWYKTGDTLPTDGFDGAYLYFKDTSELTGQTTIYRWNGTAYADTGTVVDTSNVQTFGSGQAVNGVYIKDLNGNNDPNAAGVLSAEAGKGLNEKLYGAVDETEAVGLSLSSATRGAFRQQSEATWDYSNSAVKNRAVAILGVRRSGYRKLRVTMPLFVSGQNGEGRVTFVKRMDLPTQSMSFAELVSGGYLSSVHSSYSNIYFTCGINSQYKQVTELAIPDDAVGAIFTVQLVGDATDRRNPDSVEAAAVAMGGDVMRLKENVSGMYVAGDELAVTQPQNGYISALGGLWVTSTAQHAYVDVSGMRGLYVVVRAGANNTSLLFVTAIDTVADNAVPSYVEGEAMVRLNASGEVALLVPVSANYLYVYAGVGGAALPRVYEGKPLKDAMDAEDAGVEKWVGVWPLCNMNHIGDETGTISSSGSFEMFVQPVSAGDRLRLTATCRYNGAKLRYDFRENYPVVGDVVTPMTQQAIVGVAGETTVVDWTAERSGFFVFSCGRFTSGDYAPAPNYYLRLEKLVVDGDADKTVAVGERVLHFLPAETSGGISERVADINGLYDALVTAHPECFERLTDIVADNGEGEEVRLYRLGYKDFGGLYTGYDFENPSANGYYTDPNDGGKSHEIKHVLFDAGVHGDEKTAVWGLYLFCKAVCEGTDAWAEYVRSNFVIDVIPIVCTKSFAAGSRLYPGVADSEPNSRKDPNRNFAERTIPPVDAVCAYLDAHHGEYMLHVDCHNQSNINASGKCFVSALRNGLWFDKILQFQKKYAGVCKQDWDLLTWTKPVSESPAVADPKIVMQTNVETALGANASGSSVVPKYTQAFPGYSRAYGIVSMTMEAPRRLDNTGSNYNTCDKNAGKLTADILCELLYIV